MGSAKERDQEVRFVLRMNRYLIYNILFIHFYYFCHSSLQSLGLSMSFIDRFLLSLGQKTTCFDQTWTSKIMVLFLLVATLMLGQGTRLSRLRGLLAFGYALSGLVLYFGSSFLLTKHASPNTLSCLLYIGLTLLGYRLLREAALIAHAFVLLKGGDDHTNDEMDSGPPPDWPTPPMGPPDPLLKQTRRHNKVTSTTYDLSQRNA